MYARTAFLPPEIMLQLEVELADRPGELAKFASILAKAKVNIDAMSLESGAGMSYASVIVDKPQQARRSLEEAGYRIAERTVLVVRLEDRPGALQDLAQKLGSAGIDIKTVVHLESMGRHSQLAIGVDNLEKARGLV